MARLKVGPLLFEGNMKKWWLSSFRMTFGVTTKLISKKEIIIESAPIGRVFIGQPLVNLLKWMRKQGGLRIHQYEQ